MCVKVGYCWFSFYYNTNKAAQQSCKSSTERKHVTVYSRLHLLCRKRLANTTQRHNSSLTNLLDYPHNIWTNILWTNKTKEGRFVRCDVLKKKKKKPTAEQQLNLLVGKACTINRNLSSSRYLPVLETWWMVISNGSPWQLEVLKYPHNVAFFCYRQTFF